ncbi:hypothetical protein [Rhodanobacter denitrificans]|uniref:hypothetical protein n=1 Tax=Rhodanobacter denitrificans TaxID=666685 RepID=UPI00030442BB|nr:hypothetical protein [Rhodanobacter denitrificans]UJM85331.1 hypothetical protein LRJ86_11125 [Rhodanobacter denitrificans]
MILATDGASANAGYVNPNVSAALRSFAVDYWPAHTADASLVPGAYAMTPAWPPAAPKAVSAAAAVSYFDDFYNRIHVRPAAIDLGNLVSAQTRSIVVWNAWPDTAQSLTSLLASNADGIMLTGEGALPLAFSPLQQRTWTVAVDTIGPAVIDAALQWLFAGLDPVQATITGQRLTAWMIAPDWASPVLESLTWLTDVQDAVDGSQLRLPCRDVPRREWEFGVVAEGAERQIMEHALYDWSARIWALPVWPDMTWLAAPLAAGASVISLDTTNLDYRVGGLVALYRSASRFELAEITAVAAGSLTLKQPLAKDWGVGDRAAPVRTATLTDYPSLGRSTDRLVQTQVRFQAAEDCAWPAVAPATLYLGVPVLEPRSNETGDMARVFRRRVENIDNDQGTPTPHDASGLTYASQPWQWLLHGRAERAALRSQFYWLQGRGNALWLPSSCDDITLTAAVTAAATTLSVAWAGITRFAFGKPGRRHVRIELADGRVFYRRVNAAVEVDEQTEQLGLDAALGTAVAPAQVRQISWMMLATLAGDRVELSHVTDSEGVATVAASFVGVPKEEP